ncbi:MAG TPA: LacI family DNA-binding transcriptional regulator [Candidatus Acidoferrum sp.]|nr:LacI family DNA-binding transcriptional regulator [Candidatus Acidoferrum sp.]
MKRSLRSSSPRRATVSDVARLARVSVGTVSHVLTRSRFVRPKTVLKVERAIEQLRYRPNRVAQSLIRRRTHTIGMLLPNLINPSHVDLLHAVEETLEPEGYAVLFGNSQNSPNREACYLEAFRDRGVDGVITAIAMDADATELRRVAGEMPLVMVNRRVPGWDGDSVLCDVATGMRQAVDHLVGLGHRQVAFLNGDTRIQTARFRQAAFEAAMRGHRFRPAAVTAGVFSVESGCSQTLDLLGGGAQATAICAANDVMALGALEALKKLGIQVPEGLSVVGFNDILYARLASPSLTTVHVPYGEMGTKAARLMLERLVAREKPARQVMVMPQLIVRHSTAQAPGASRLARV